MIEAGDVVVVILAAGLSRRFGPADKLLAPYRGSPLVTHAARLALAFPFRQRLAVVHQGSDVGAALATLGFALHINPSPERGLGSSLAIGVAAIAASDAAACLILLGDMPNVTLAHVERLLQAFAPPIDIVASSDGRHRTPPTLFGQRHFAELRQLTADRGAAALTAHAPAIAADPATLADVDLPADLPVG